MILYIQVKNVVDVTLGGITYWSLGYGLSFGPHKTPFLCWGHFFVNYREGPAGMGSFYSHYVFHFSFATAATTIVSGAVAERMKLTAYMIFSAVNTFIYALPASWVWNTPHGFLGALGFYDFAGAAVVHMVGGSSALAAAWVLGPRYGRFGDRSDSYGMSSPVTALTGTFMLWWAWLSFNCGSTFGISGDSWKVAAKVGVNTLNGSIGGSAVGLILTYLLTFRSEGGHYFDIGIAINAILGGLLGVTASCAVIDPTESLFIGGVGAAIAVGATPLIQRLRIDDPVGAIPVHLCAGIWSVLSVGVFARNEFDPDAGPTGLLHGGGFQTLAIQAIGTLVIALWAFLTTLATFLVLKATIGVRMEPHEEEMGADAAEHRVMKTKSSGANKKINDLLERLSTNTNAGDDDVLHQLLGELVRQGLNAERQGERIRNFTGTRSEHVPRSQPESRRASNSAMLQSVHPPEANGQVSKLRPVHSVGLGERRKRVERPKRIDRDLTTVEENSVTIPNGLAHSSSPRNSAAAS